MQIDQLRSCLDNSAEAEDWLKSWGVEDVRRAHSNLLGIAQVFTAGMVLCLMLRITGSLWMSIGFHTTWDWAQSYLYGTPDSATMMKGHLLISHAAGNIQLSGGTAGPEGSVLAPLGLIAGPLLLVWIGRRLGLVDGGWLGKGQGALPPGPPLRTSP